MTEEINSLLTGQTPIVDVNMIGIGKTIVDTVEDTPNGTLPVSNDEIITSRLIEQIENEYSLAWPGAKVPPIEHFIPWRELKDILERLYKKESQSSREQK